MSDKYILYVEDDTNNQMLIRLFLREEPYEIITANSPDDARNALSLQSFDIIIVDLNLQKDGDGVELIRAIRNMPGYESIPIFVFSGFDKNHFRQYHIEELIQQYFQKPTSKKKTDRRNQEFWRYSREPKVTALSCSRSSHNS